MGDDLWVKLFSGYDMASVAMSMQQLCFFLYEMYTHRERHEHKRETSWKKGGSIDKGDG